MFTMAINPVEASNPVKSGTPDIGVVNNSEKKLTITVQVYPQSSQKQSVFEGTWKLKGRNQTGLEEVSEAYFRGNVEVSNLPVDADPGDFVVDAQIPSGVSDSTQVFVGHDGFPADQTVSVYANNTDDVEVIRAL